MLHFFCIALTNGAESWCLHQHCPSPRKIRPTYRPVIILLDLRVRALRVFKLKTSNELACHMFPILEIHSNPSNEEQVICLLVGRKRSQDGMLACIEQLPRIVSALADFFSMSDKLMASGEAFHSSAHESRTVTSGEGSVSKMRLSI